MSNVLGNYAVKSKGAKPPVFTSCDLLNVSYCPLTETSKNFVVTAYNPLGRTVSTYLRIPMASSSIAVYNPQGQPVKSQVLPISDETIAVRKQQNLSDNNSKYELVFQVKIPALGFATYFVNLTKSKSKNFKAHKTQVEDVLAFKDEPVVIQNDFVKLEFSKDTGLLSSMTDLESKLTSTVNQQFLWYNASIGNKISGQPSGAYIFRPNSSNTFNVSTGGKAKISIMKGSLVQEVRQIFSPFVSQVVRLYTGQRYAEFEYTIGPIPIQDKLGKEIISRFDTDIKSNGLFYTDANGREMQERKRDFRPTWKLNVTEPIAGNYYPVNSRMYIKDSSKQLTVLVDRSLGGASIKDGSVEIMPHRRLLVDDKRGVAEPLNESGISGKGLIVRGKMCVFLAPPAKSAALHRELGEQMLLEPVLSFAPNPSTAEKWMSQYNTLHSGLKSELPANVHLLTLETMDQNALIRVEHQFEAGEDAKLSAPVNISFDDLFTDFDVVSTEELNLAANQDLKDKKPMKWNIKTLKKLKKELNERNLHDKHRSAKSSIELQPMQIRTFEAKIKPRMRRRHRNFFRRQNDALSFHKQ